MPSLINQAAHGHGKATTTTSVQSTPIVEKYPEIMGFLVFVILVLGVISIAILLIVGGLNEKKE